MNVGEAIKKGFTMTNMALSVMIGLFVYNLIIGLISLPVQMKFASVVPGQQMGPEAFTPTIVLIILAQFLLSLIIFPLIVAGLLHIFNSIKDESSEVDLSMFMEGKQHFMKVFLLWITYLALTVVAILVGAIFAALPAALLSNVGGTTGPSPLAIGVSVVFFGLVFLAYGIGIIFLIFSPYEVVVKGKGVFQAMASSAGIVKANLLKTIAVCFILFFVSLVIGVGINLILGPLVTGPMKNNLMIISVISIIFSSAISAYYIPFVGATLMALYKSVAAGCECGEVCECGEEETKPEPPIQSEE